MIIITKVALPILLALANMVEAIDTEDLQ